MTNEQLESPMPFIVEQLAFVEPGANVEAKTAKCQKTRHRITESQRPPSG